MEFGDQHRRDENEEVEEQEMLVNNDNVNNNNMIIAAPAVPPRPRYRDCMKNHAINMTVHAVDGCGEFMPGGPEGSIEALRCAACTCHRNFHRKVEPGDVYPPPAPNFVTYRPPPPPAAYNAQPQPLALPSPGGAGGSLSKEYEDDHVEMGNPNGGEMVAGGSETKKRFRTKFTQEQKDKMLAMAQRIGWRLKRTDEELVQQFCNESGVKRGVFKVWMHNHRFNLGGSNGNNNSSSQ